MADAYSRLCKKYELRPSQVYTDSARCFSGPIFRSLLERTLDPNEMTHDLDGMAEVPIYHPGPNYYLECRHGHLKQLIALKMRIDGKSYDDLGPGRCMQTNFLAIFSHAAEALRPHVHVNFRSVWQPES